MGQITSPDPSPQRMSTVPLSELLRPLHDIGRRLKVTVREEWKQWICKSQEGQRSKVSVRNFLNMFNQLYAK